MTDTKNTDEAVTIKTIKNIPLNGSRNNPNMREAYLSNDVTLFISYRTVVAAHLPSKGYVRTDTSHSVTTSKHINKWLGRNMMGSLPAGVVTQQALDDLLPKGFYL